MLAFRLPVTVFEDDRILDRLLCEVAADPHGRLLEVQIEQIHARLLYAIPAVMLPALPWGNSEHRAWNFDGGKRYAWRAHDEAVLEAIDQGRDLVGVLARHYAISRGLVRAPICSVMWGDTALSHPRLLRLLDGIPAHRRPTDPDAFTPAIPLFIMLNFIADDTDDLRRIGATAFSQGLEAVCTPLHARFAPLGPASADVFDFIRAAADRAAQLGPYPRGLTLHRLELRWIEIRGFQSLFAASQRWHAGVLDRPKPDAQDQTRIASILGEHRVGEALGRELCKEADLTHEGETMQHCVADYWIACRDRGTRIFALSIGAERATAEYGFELDDAQFSLEQLRGPHNVESSCVMVAFAQTIQDALNARERAPAREALADSVLAMVGRSNLRMTRRPARRLTRPLDPRTEHELAAVLKSLRPALAEGEIVRECIAGYQYYGGLELESGMSVGDALELVREQENPRDPAAVSIHWAGHHIGDVPRCANADIARRLDSGEHLVGRLTRLNATAEIRERVEFAILRTRQD
ncbi:MAG: hypothetical protein EOM22_11085 [Gammaproteobacteria bacterium]|nr:hypothetical protein [Gammaproteobacteria bacterium]